MFKFHRNLGVKESLGSQDIHNAHSGSFDQNVCESLHNIITKTLPMHSVVIKPPPYSLYYIITKTLHMHCIINYMMLKLAKTLQYDQNICPKHHVMSTKILPMRHVTAVWE